MNRKAILAALRRAMDKPARRLSRTQLGATARGGGLSAAEAAAVGAVPAVAAPGIAWAAGNVSPMSELTEMEDTFLRAKQQRMDDLWAELERKRQGY